MRKIRPKMILYSDEEEFYLGQFDYTQDGVYEWASAQDFSEFNFIERFLWRSLLSRLYGVKLRYKKFLVYPPYGGFC